MTTHIIIFPVFDMSKRGIVIFINTYVSRLFREAYVYEFRPFKRVCPSQISIPELFYSTAGTCGKLQKSYRYAAFLSQSSFSHSHSRFAPKKRGKVVVPGGEFLELDIAIEFAPLMQALTLGSVLSNRSLSFPGRLSHVGSRRNASIFAFDRSSSIQRVERSSNSFLSASIYAEVCRQ